MIFSIIKRYIFSSDNVAYTSAEPLLEGGKILSQISANSGPAVSEIERGDVPYGLLYRALEIYIAPVIVKGDNLTQ